MKINSLFTTSLCLLVIILLSNCSTPPPTSCKYGTAEPIFSDTLKKVVRHHFQKNGLVTTEEIDFENGLQTVIQQSGCDSIRQVFQFKLPGDLRDQNADYFKEMSIHHFGYLSSVSRQHFSLQQISATIEAEFQQLNLGEPFELQPGYFIRIDRILGSEDGILLVELSSHH